MTTGKEILQKEIGAKYDSIIQQIDLLEEEIFKLQLACEHPRVVKEYKADEGNYDSSVDSYWIDWKCPDCHKWWRTDQ
jgi:hypothetical protein